SRCPTPSWSRAGLSPAPRSTWPAPWSAAPSAGSWAWPTAPRSPTRSCCATSTAFPTWSSCWPGRRRARRSGRCEDDEWSVGPQRGGIRFGPPGVGVDRADLLAEVAAEDPVADQGPDLERDGAAMLDRPEGDAAAVVEHAGGDQGARGADPQAGVAGAAALVQ